MSTIENRLAAIDLATRLQPSDVTQLLSDASTILSFVEQEAQPATRAATTPTADPEPTTVRRGRGRPPKAITTQVEKAEAEDAEPVEPEAEVEPAPAPEVEQPPKSATKPLKTSVTLETLKASVEMAIKAGIRDDVKQILGKHGATNLTTLKEAKYGEFAADLDTALLNS